MEFIDSIKNILVNQFSSLLSHQMIIMNNTSTYFTLIATIIFIISAPQMLFYKKSNLKKNFAFTIMVYIGFFISSLSVFLSNNLIALFSAWEFMSILSYFLIKFDMTNDSAKAAQISLIANLISGSFLLMSILILRQYNVYYLTEINQIATKASTFHVYMINISIFLAVIVKSAQFPFHFWLLKAMKAPAPVTSLLHSATIIKSGLYLALQIAHYSPATFKLLLYALQISSIMTCIFTCFRMIAAEYIKEFFALTTISSVSLMYYTLPLFAASDIASFLYIANHAVYKSAIFLICGIIEHKYGVKKISQLETIGMQHNKMLIFLLLMCLYTAVGMPYSCGEYSYTVYNNIPLSYKFYFIKCSSILNSSAILIIILKIFRSNQLLQNKLNNKHLYHMSIILLFLPLIYTTTFQYYFRYFTMHRFTLPTIAYLCLGTASIAIARKLFVQLNYKPQNLINMFLKFAVAFIQIIYKILFDIYNKISFITSLGICFITIIIFWTIANNGEFSLYNITYVMQSSEITLLIIVLLLIYSGIYLVQSSHNTFIKQLVGVNLIGFSVGILYIIIGAPDVAITHFLAEIISSVFLYNAFFSTKFFNNSKTTMKSTMYVLFLFGIGIFIFLIQIDAENFNDIATEAYVKLSQSFNSNNIVNMIVTDYRGFDTWGEMTVICSTGIIILYLNNKSVDMEKQHLHYPISNTSIIRTIIPTVAVPMIFNGHNIPGGGFVVGLICGIYIYIKTIQNIQCKYNNGNQYLIAAIALSIFSSIAPLFWQKHFFTNMVSNFSFALLFDIAIMMAVIGLVKISLNKNSI